MPNPNAIVSNVIKFDSQLDSAPTEMLRAERELFVELDNERRVRLDPTDIRSVGFTEILEGLSKQRLPVYLEIDPHTSSITRLVIPHVTRVSAMQATGEGHINVELEFSSARHTLRQDQSDFAELEKQLQEAVRSGEPFILSEDDTHNIIDIRPFKPEPDVPLPPSSPKVPPLEGGIKNILEQIWFWKWWPWWWFRCISMARAQQVFDAMNATSCEPLTVPPSCIPFLYPDDGCWARAHEMCRLMINMGLSPKGLDSFKSRTLVTCKHEK